MGHHVQVERTHLAGDEVDERADALGQLAAAEVAQVVPAVVGGVLVQAADRQTGIQRGGIDALAASEDALKAVFR